MNLFQRLIAWLTLGYWSEPKCHVQPGPPPEYPQLLNIGAGLYVVGPTPELVAEAQRWNEIAGRYPPVRLTGMESATWH